MKYTGMCIIRGTVFQVLRKSAKNYSKYEWHLSKRLWTQADLRPNRGDAGRTQMHLFSLFHQTLPGCFRENAWTSVSLLFILKSTVFFYKGFLKLKNNIKICPLLIQSTALGFTVRRLRLSSGFHPLSSWAVIYLLLRDILDPGWRDHSSFSPSHTDCTTALHH